jgi:hypothetical protein
LAEVVIKRGLDVDRRDGTLGTPAEGELIYTTDRNVLWVGDGATGGGVPASKPPAMVTMYANSTQDINALASDNLMLWDIHTSVVGVAQSGGADVCDILHSNSTDKWKITINTGGIYAISCTIAVDATGSTPTRWNGIMRVVHVDGTTAVETEVGPQAKGGYLREASGQDETSLTIPQFSYTFSLDSTDYFYIKVDREASTTAAVDTTALASTLFIQRLA